jgi:hypothetical protein
MTFAFQMDKSTVSKIVLKTSSAIWEELVEEYMPKPTMEN